MNRSTLLWTGGVVGVLMDSSLEHLRGGKNRFSRFISGEAELHIYASSGEEAQTVGGFTGAFRTTLGISPRRF